MISVQNICKSFGKEEVLKDISVDFLPGKIHGIIGKNGSGKTVLFKIICGYLHPSSGKVVIDGKVIGQDIEMPENIGIIIETPGFLSSSSGIKNLEYLASIRKKIGKEEIKSIMRRVGLDPNLKKKVGKYSLGMKQRLGIAQAIMENPDIIILDEPMNSLDTEAVSETRKIINELKAAGKTIILASHAKEDIESLCDDVYRLLDGKLRKES